MTERKMIKMDKPLIWLLLKILELKKECFYCKKKINETNIGGVYSKPNRVLCDSILCLCSLVDDKRVKL